MNVDQQLKDIAKYHRWAFRELLFDAMMIEANQMINDRRKQFAYLKSRYGTGKAVVENLVICLHPDLRKYVHGSDKERLNYVAKHYPDYFDVFVVETKTAEAATIFLHINEVYKQLIVIFGDKKKVTKCLLSLIVEQRRPFKTRWALKSATK